MENVTIHGTHPSQIDETAPGSGVWHAVAWEVEFTIEADGPEVQPFALCQLTN